MKRMGDVAVQLMMNDDLATEAVIRFLAEQYGKLERLSESAICLALAEELTDCRSIPTMLAAHEAGDRMVELGEFLENGDAGPSLTEKGRVALIERRRRQGLEFYRQMPRPV
jgi:hypothetical protein